jgi:hypothetical protein
MQQTSPSRAFLLSPPLAAGNRGRKSASAASPSASNKQGFTRLCLLLNRRRMSRSIGPSGSKGKGPRRGSEKTAEKLCVTKQGQKGSEEKKKLCGLFSLSFLLPRPHHPCRVTSPTSRQPRRNRATSGQPGHTLVFARKKWRHQVQFMSLIIFPSCVL